MDKVVGMQEAQLKSGKRSRMSEIPDKNTMKDKVRRTRTTITSTSVNPFLFFMT